MEYEQNIIDYWKSLEKTVKICGRIEMDFLTLFINKGYNETKMIHSYCANEESLTLILNKVKRYIGNIKVRCSSCKKGMVPNPDIIAVYDPYFGSKRVNYLSISTNGMQTIGHRPNTLFRCLFCGGIGYTFKE